MEKGQVETIVRKHRHEKAALLAILHEIQEHDKELSVESLRYVSELLKEPFAHVYGLATFYSAFSTSRKGQIEIRACDGISCYLKGSERIITKLKERLGVEEKQTTWDGKYSLERVHCLGLCSIGPNVSFNEKIYSGTDEDKVLELLASDGEEE
jgi:NADH:ubiquinone oxidoreductase subunit E